MASELELYPSDADLWLEFGGIYNAPSIITNLLVDADMELAGVANYPAFGGATVSKQAGGVKGSYCLRCARVAGAGTYGASPGGINTNTDYMISGWARGDGTAEPRVEIGNGPTWFGSPSTTWQYFTLTANSGAGNVVYLHSGTNGYVEFDAITLTPLSAITGNAIRDWNMEAADTSAWTGRNSPVLSKQTGSPRPGGKVLRVANGAGSASASQPVLVNGARYRITGWARSDGTIIPYASITGNYDWSGTNSTQWQWFDFTALSDWVGLGLVAFGRKTADAGYVEFADVTATRISAVIDNLAERGGAPKLVTCGDGITANTIPTQATGRRGVIFDAATKYIETSLLYPTLRTQQFTVFALIGLYSQSFWGMCGTRANDASAIGFDVQFGSAATKTEITTLFSNDAAANKYMQVQSILPVALVTGSGGGQLLSFAVSYSGTGVAAGITHYANGTALAKTTLLDSLGANNFASPNTFRIGRRVGGGGASVRQDLYAFMMFPTLASALQIKNLHRYVMSRINL